MAVWMRSASRASVRGQPVSISADSRAGVTTRVAAPPSMSIQ